jgi:hypothetical protein
MKTNSLIHQHQGSLSFPLLKTLAFSLIILLTGTSAFSQPQGREQGRSNATPEERAKHQTEMMKTQLSLTSAQEQKVSAINLKYANKMEDLRKTPENDAQHKAAMSIQTQKDNELKGVLTDTQYKDYLKKKEEMKNRRHDTPHSN